MMGGESFNRQSYQSMTVSNISDSENPLEGVDSWQDFVAEKVYPLPNSRAKSDYRNYENPGRDCVKVFYQVHHEKQTFDQVRLKEAKWLPARKKKMSVMEALDFLNTLVDDSDPDTHVEQLQHLLQTSEAIRKDGHEDWFILAGFLHDLGKVLCLFGEPQWAVVGDTHPVGCRFSERIVYSEYFEANPDSNDLRYNTELGIYEAGCGLRNVHMSWGHDEYMYHILKNYLPEPALYMVRYHSFYSWHREGDYDYLCDDHDREMLPWVKKFNPYDLYTKCPQLAPWDQLKDYYEELIHRFLPNELNF